MASTPTPVVILPQAKAAEKKYIWAALNPTGSSKRPLSAPLVAPQRLRWQKEKDSDALRARWNPSQLNLMLQEKLVSKAAGSSARTVTSNSLMSGCLKQLGFVEGGAQKVEKVGCEEFRKGINSVLGCRLSDEESTDFFQYHAKDQYTVNLKRVVMHILLGSQGYTTYNTHVPHLQLAKAYAPRYGVPRQKGSTGKINLSDVGPLPLSDSEKIRFG